jgi:gliding motility-associated-like protein
MSVQLVVESAFGCLDTLEKNLTIVVRTPANFSVFIDSCEGKAVFINQSPDGVYYDWNFGDVGVSSSPNTVYSFSANGVYTITLTVNKGTGCEEFKQEQINYYVNDGEHVYMPNAFTPNDDGTNDVFRIENRVPCDVYSIDIFDRWGEVIFHADDALAEFWDGRYKNHASQEGVYVYVLNGAHSHISGHIALIK